MIHAVEELYFFRHYEHAMEFISDVLSGSESLDGDTQQLLATYQDKCQKNSKLKGERERMDQPAELLKTE